MPAFAADLPAGWQTHIDKAGNGGSYMLLLVAIKAIAYLQDTAPRVANILRRPRDALSVSAILFVRCALPGGQRS